MTDTAGNNTISAKIMVTKQEDKDKLLKKGLRFRGKRYREDSLVIISPDKFCPTWCYWGHITLNCPNVDKSRYQLCAGPQMARKHGCVVTSCRTREGKRFAYMNVTYANCRGSHYAISVICPARKQAINLAYSGKDEWRMLELEKLQRRAEEEGAERVKEVVRNIQVAAMAEVKHDAARPVTRDRDDRDLRMRNVSKVQETQGLKTSQYANTDQGISKPPP